MLLEYRNANPRLKNNDYDYFLFETDAKKHEWIVRKQSLRKDAFLKGQVTFLKLCL